LIDLHCHLLAGLDDGPQDPVESVAMARISHSEGITTIACTPHILPGVYDNAGPAIRGSINILQRTLHEAGIPITLVVGADVHIAPNVLPQLRSGQALSLNDTRYVLIEPPHHILPPNIEDAFFNLTTGGYTPILTHPERMTWIERNYGIVQRLANAGVLMQLTAAALTGKFGRRARYWSERMLDDGLFHIMATDAHDAVRRPPLMRAAFEAACKRVGEAEATQLVLHRPQAILENRRVAARQVSAESSVHERKGISLLEWIKSLRGS
jgi:protein-tyrosine phosphatase